MIPFAMKRLHVVVSLITQDNDRQVEAAAAAEDTAGRLGVDVEILYPDNDSIQQSQQKRKPSRAWMGSFLNRSAGRVCRKWPGPPWPPGSLG